MRWYGVLFASGFLFGYWIVTQMFKAEKAPEQWLDTIFFFMVGGGLIGARLGHVFFYEWDYYAEHLSEIPAVWRGGLASHGGAIGVLLALWIFSRFVSKRSMLWVLDKVVVPCALAACLIRLGNLMNSEIVGIPTDVAWAFEFVRHAEVNRIPLVPRHPAQLYEAIGYLIIFAILFFTYWKTEKRKQEGFLFGLFLVLVFCWRFVVEPFKASQGGFETALGDALSTGQWLSVPFILAGVFFMVRSRP
jgi:prolipoprotein diacylglyceryl transferase